MWDRYPCSENDRFRLQMAPRLGKEAGSSKPYKNVDEVGFEKGMPNIERWTDMRGRPISTTGIWF